VTLILGSLLVFSGLAAGHTLERRDLRRQGRDGAGHGHHGHGHGHGHGNGRRGGRRNNRRNNNRRSQARSAFEAGGYSAAIGDDYDALPGYVPEDDTTTTLPDYEYDSTDVALADDSYAGPGGAASDPALGYDAPDAAAADAGYAGPGLDEAADAAAGGYDSPTGDAADADYAYDDSLPGEEGADDLAGYAGGADDQPAYVQEARARRNGKSPAVGNQFPFNAVRSNVKFCPGGKLDSCIAICPGAAARIYASCVRSCGNRCNL